METRTVTGEGTLTETEISKRSGEVRETHSSGLQRGGGDAGTLKKAETIKGLLETGLEQWTGTEIETGTITGGRDPIGRNSKRDRVYNRRQGQ
jgi:hypothetical protein